MADAPRHPNQIEWERYAWGIALNYNVGFWTPWGPIELLKNGLRSLRKAGWERIGIEHPYLKPELYHNAWVGQIRGIGEVGGLLSGPRRHTRGVPPKWKQEWYLELSLSAFWSDMAQNSDDPLYARKAAVLDRWMLRYLYSVCASAPFAYAGIQFEDSVPSPEELMRGSYGDWPFLCLCLSTAEYSQADLEELATVYAEGSVDRQPTFWCFTSEACYNRRGRSFAISKSAQRAIASVLLRRFETGR